MKYCPQCGSEYLDHIAFCSDCDESLITQGEFERLKAEEDHFHQETRTLVKVSTLKDRFEADLLTRELEKEGISVMVRSFKDTAYDGIYIPQRGWGELRVPEKDGERAKEIIGELKQLIEEGKVEISDDEEIVACPRCGAEFSLSGKECPHCHTAPSDDGREKDLE